MKYSTARRDRITKADRLRERELFRYYRPDQYDAEASNTHATSQASSPDTTLTALAQLVAIRLNVKSVLINVITKDTQYTISEGTKTLNLTDTRKADSEEDALWIGCGSLTKNEALCENTVALTGVPGGTNPFFTVPDLSKDDRFENLFYVKGKPHWRFYSGCPLTTKNGVNIGALCILDDTPRFGLTIEEESFANTIAQTIMRYLEMSRETEERKKGTRMSRGLNAFVEGKTWLAPEDIGGGVLSPVKIELDRKTSKPSLDHSSSSNNEASDYLSNLQSPVNLSGVITQSGTMSPAQGDIQAGQVHTDIDIQQRVTFSRAANLLRESLDLRRGGVVFLDTVVGFSTGDDEASAGSSSSTEDSTQDDAEKPFTKSRKSSGYSRTTFQSSVKSENDPKKAGVLGKCAEISLDPANVDDISAFTPLSETGLQQLIKRYPRGKLWAFDEEGSLSSSEEEIRPQLSRKASEIASQRRHRRKMEAKMLQSCFRQVRQLLFVPLWDAGAARFFSGCFAWTTSPTQIFSTETELSFVVAFGNSVMAEVSRLTTIAADQQKGDFIGSISHELRSPLHGILASAEFLGETDCDSFQMSLVHTIDSCGRTLLDTINHVLDFSKINSFERNFKKRRPVRNTSVSSSKVPQMPQIMNIYAITDVAAVCEEVVEGVYAGQVYQDISSSDISDITPGNRGKTLDRGLATANRSLLGGAGAQFARKTLDVVLDIEPGDYTFTTQPGALRRVVMNLVTNSLKYTEQGMVLVKLSLHDLGDSHPADKDNGQLLELIVRDTGKGISSQYLRTRLFTPFAQENSLQPGTGLGLSIVRSITNMLGGSIEIKSEVGKGTEVKVELPLLRVTGIDTPVSTPNTISSMERPQDDSIAILQSEASGMSVAFYGLQSSGKSIGAAAAKEMERALHQYISLWFGLEVIVMSPGSQNPDFIIVDEANLSELLSKKPRRSSVIALCTNSSRYSQNGVQGNGKGVEYLSKPFGPFKLAKALRLCLEKIKPGGSARTPLTEPSRSNSTLTARSPGPGIEFEALTLEGEDECTPINAQTAGNITAGESENALMAVESSPMSASLGSGKQSGADFPFPQQDSPVDASRPRANMAREYSRRPALRERKTEPLIQYTTWTEIKPSAASRKGETVTAPPIPPTKNVPMKRPPRILLVDDNKINLRLLKTFMMKREYQLVDSADNGQLAVEAAKMQLDGYDVIFMDISMPVMNGFEATRAIRQIEESRRTGSPDDHAPALIIALTGLASSRDQSEAFTSGVDLFMTKPVSFKEVGRLLDNWEANGGSTDLAPSSPR
ncbi:hypothetical protein MMC26_002499 [Xylographa opegraphella]|nr:hypothetical protein [Xylographa opegraphella]